MGITVKEYLARLEDMDLMREINGFYTSEDSRIRVEDSPAGYNRCKIDGHDFCLKHGSEEVFTFSSFLTELCMGRAYNDLGVNSVNYYPINIKLPNRYVKMLKVVSQNVNKLSDDLVCATPSQVLAKITPSYEKEDIWRVFKDSDIRAKLLQLMTEECFNKLIDLYLLDNLTSQGDRHGKNLFFVKNKDSGLWEDVIAIDNEILNLNSFSLTTRDPKDVFQTFLKTRGFAYFPSNCQTILTHEERIRCLNDLIASGDLSRERVDFLKKALDYDITTRHGELSKEYKFPHRELVLKHREMLARLWDYNRDNLELN